MGFLVSVVLFLLRIYVTQGWFIVTYGLGIFLLNNLIGFLSPQVCIRLCGSSFDVNGDSICAVFHKVVCMRQEYRALLRVTTGR